MKQKRRPSLMVLCLTGSVTGCGGGSDSVGPSGPPAPAPPVASVVVTPATTTFATAGETVQLRAPRLRSEREHDLGENVHLVVVQHECGDGQLVRSGDRRSQRVRYDLG